MWNITRLPGPGGRAPSSSSIGGEVYDHGARKSDRKKMAPDRRTRSRTCATTASGSPDDVAGDSGVLVMRGGVVVMVRLRRSSHSGDRPARSILAGDLVHSTNAGASNGQ